MRVSEIDPGESYRQRYAEWQRRFLHEGATRAYPYAWRLPEASRGLGASQQARAQYALALTLYTLGRYREADQALPTASLLSGAEQSRCLGLGRRCAWQLGIDVFAPQISDDLAAQSEAAQFDWLSGSTVTLTERLPTYRQAAAGDELENAWCEVLTCWTQASQGRAFQPTAGQEALAEMRRLAPAIAAHAEAVFAEATFLQAPRWSLVWLDVALDGAERYAQHHCQARLQAAKAQALLAAGELREAERFRKLARQLAQRQGDQRLLARMMGEADQEEGAVTILRIADLDAGAMQQSHLTNDGQA